MEGTFSMEEKNPNNSYKNSGLKVVTYLPIPHRDSSKKYSMEGGGVSNVTVEKPNNVTTAR